MARTFTPPLQRFQCLPLAQARLIGEYALFRHCSVRHAFNLPRRYRLHPISEVEALEARSKDQSVACQRGIV